MPKATRRGTHNVIAQLLAATMAAKNTDVARRAYELYCDRGQTDGHDLDDWLQAERELRGASTATAA